MHLRLLAILGLLFFIMNLEVAPASAHAQVVATYPIDGSIVKSAPDVIVLSWGEDVRTNAKQFALTNTTGIPVKTSFNYRFDKTTGEGSASLTPIKKLEDGSYIVSWKVISRDGHLVAGANTFGINVKSINAKSSTTTSYFDELLQGIFWTLMILAFGALMASRKRLFLLAARLILAVSVIRILNSYSVLHGAFASTGSSKISILALIIFAIVLILPKRELAGSDRLKFTQLSFLTLLFVLQPFFEGHPLDVVQPGYLKYVSAAHLLFAYLWTGSVTAFILLRTRDQYAITRRISTVSIFLLVVFGSVLTYFLALPLSFASKSAWESFILIKIAIVLTALLIGAYHHFAAKKFLENPEFNFSKSLLLEGTAIIGIVASTALLVSYTPPKITANQYKISQRLISANSGKNYLQIPVTFDNGLKGTFYIQKVLRGKPSMIMLAVSSKKTLKSLGVEAYFSNTELNIIDLHAKLTGASNQYMSYLSIPAAGKWHISIQILLDEFTQTQANFNVKI